jgi:tetratricopeptide (TPR) repeat protein
MADQLKSRVDKCFKLMDFEEAASLYQEVVDMKEGNQIILNSNLSACYFEIGDYEKCMDYANKVKEMLFPSEEAQKGIYQNEHFAAMASEQKAKILEKNDVQIKKCQHFLNPILPTENNAQDLLKKEVEWRKKLMDFVRD